MRAAGALLIILGCTLYGFLKAAVLCKRARCLGAFLESLRFMEAELIGRATPLPEMLLQLSETARPEVRGFYKALSEKMDAAFENGFASLWRETLLNGELLCLSPYQRAELERPGAMLGRYDHKEQVGAIESALSRLEPELRRANGRAKDGLRLYTGLGLVGGIMAATVML